MLLIRPTFQNPLAVSPGNTSLAADGGLRTLASGRRLVEGLDVVDPALCYRLFGNYREIGGCESICWECVGNWIQV